uniref:Protochlorophyllide reductase n=1 Tax=Pinguiococcus pyrenoidosus TaxID=172671 RepID=A0A7R9U312_9STRA
MAGSEAKSWVVATLNSLFSMLVFTYCSAFILFRAGDVVHLAKNAQFVQALFVFAFANFLLPRLTGIRLPGPRVLALLTVAGIYYFLDVHTAERSFPPADLTGKVAVVTGANSGIGYATAWALAARNATVVMGCRSDRKCQKAAAELTASAVEAAPLGPSVGELVPMRLDLADLAVVDYFSLMVAQKYPRVDILVNNAGYFVRKQEPPTRQGLERSFGSMHIGHFALTEWIIRRNKGGAKGLSVMNVASGMHHFCQLYTLERGLTGGGWDDACLPREFFKAGFRETGRKGYMPMKHWPGALRALVDVRYHRAKLANVLHTYELPKRHKGVFASSADLGFAASNITVMHKALNQNLGNIVSVDDLQIMRKGLPHGIRPVLLGATYPFVKKWARGVGIKDKNGGLFDPIGDASAAFTLEKALGMKDIGGQKKLAKQLYDASAKIFADFEKSRNGSMDEQR